MLQNWQDVAFVLLFGPWQGRNPKSRGQVLTSRKEPLFSITKNVTPEMNLFVMAIFELLDDITYLVSLTSMT